MEEYIVNKLMDLCDAKSIYFGKIMEILSCNAVDENEYYEIHHIIPKSIEKDLEHDPNNLIKLTAYDHMMIHFYYYKASKTDEMKFKNKRMLLFVTKDNASKTRIDKLTENQMQEIAQIVASIKSEKTCMSLKDRENMRSSDPFICLNTGKIYTNISFCMEELKIHNLVSVLSGKLNSSGGYYFIYCNDKRLETMTHQQIIDSIIREKRESYKNKRLDICTTEWKEHISKGHGSKNILCLETNEVFKTQAECADKLGVCRGLLCQRLNTKKYPIKTKYHFIYLEEKGELSNEEWIEKISNYSKEINGNLNRYNAKQVICEETGTIYNSIAEAVRITGIKGVARCCLGVSKSAKGYHFKYVERGGINYGRFDA